jgi:glucosylceramidase
VQRTHQAAPDLALIQTENECGDGSNSWAHAHYVFDLMQHYLANGARAYVYWNMVLEPQGRSSWGWTQTALVTVDPDTGSLTRNPEYWLMRHVAGLVRPGAQVLVPDGRWAANALAFRNPDGRAIAVLQNPLAEDVDVVVDLAGARRRVALPAASFTTLAS